MAKMKMKTVRIIALRQDRKRLLEHLQDSALVQLTKSETSREGFKRVNVSSQMQVFERNVELTKQALKILENASPEKAGMLASFKGRREIDPDEIGEIAAQAKGVIEACTKITELDKLCADNAAEQIRIKTQLAQLESWQNLDIPLNTGDTRSTAVFIGSLPEQYTEQRLKEALAAENPKLEFETEIQYSEANLTNVVLFAPKSQKAMAEEVQAAGSEVAGKTFAVTGDVHKFKNRNELTAFIEDRGGKCAGSVSKKTFALINNDPGSMSGKNKKARELGIPIITEEEFLRALEEGEYNAN